MPQSSGIPATYEELRPSVLEDDLYDLYSLLRTAACLYAGALRGVPYLDSTIDDFYAEVNELRGRVAERLGNVDLAEVTRDAIG